MGNRTYRKIFTGKPELLQEMLDLRRQGWSFPRLGKKYGIDHGSVFYQVKKHGVKVKPELLQQFHKNREYTYSLHPSQQIPITERDIKMGVVKINQGKDYREYLREQKIQLRDFGGWKCIKTKKQDNESSKFIHYNI